MHMPLKSKPYIFFWIGSIFIIVSIGVYYIPREYHNTGFWETLYFTLRLFVFEHDFPAFPKSGPLIFIHFAAPLITISAAGAAISYLLSLPPTLRTRLMSECNILILYGIP